MLRLVQALLWNNLNTRNAWAFYQNNLDTILPTVRISPFSEDVNENIHEKNNMKINVRFIRVNAEMKGCDHVWEDRVQSRLQARKYGDD